MTKRRQTPRRPGLDDRRYWHARERLKKIGDHICHICRYPIDMQLKSPHPLSWTADHKVARSTLSDPHDPGHWHIDNLLEAHRWCNTSRGAKPLPTPPELPLNPPIDW